MMENTNLNDFLTRPQQYPYMTSLLANGTLFINSVGLAHPSLPNYLLLFTGDQQSRYDDSYWPPVSACSPNLATALFDADISFGGFAENLPSTGWDGGDANSLYANRHAPWTRFSRACNFSGWNVDFNHFASFTQQQSFCSLPTVSMIAPNLCNDQHSCNPCIGDQWLQTQLGDYIAWAQTHNSLLIIQYDEDRNCDPCSNRIPTLFLGEMVRPGRINTAHIDHFSLLRFLLDAYQVPLFHPSLPAACPLPSDLWTESLPTPGAGTCDISTATDCLRCDSTVIASLWWGASLSARLDLVSRPCGPILTALSSLTNQPLNRFCLGPFPSGNTVFIGIAPAAAPQPGADTLALQLVMFDEQSSATLRDAGIVQLTWEISPYSSAAPTLTIGGRALVLSWLASGLILLLGSWLL
jgi:acid phosphatase